MSKHSTPNTGLYLSFPSVKCGDMIKIPVTNVKEIKFGRSHSVYKMQAVAAPS